MRSRPSTTSKWSYRGPMMTEQYDVPEGCTFEMIALDNIEATAATQVRVRIDRGIVDEYTEAFKNGADFPAIDVYREDNSERNIMADGFHRHRAAVNAERGEIGCIVHPGGLHDALMHALGANNDHGFRRTNADKRHAVEMALKDPEISEMQQQEIADICRVTRQTVRRIQNDLLAQDSSNGNDGTKSHDKEPEDPEGNFRDNGAEPTQGEVELGEVRQACSMIKVLPYPGEGALKLDMEPDDIADLEYVSTWMASAVIAYRSQGDGDG